MHTYQQEKMYWQHNNSKISGAVPFLCLLKFSSSAVWIHACLYFCVNRTLPRCWPGKHGWPSSHLNCSTLAWGLELSRSGRVQRTRIAPFGQIHQQTGSARPGWLTTNYLSLYLILVSLIKHVVTYILFPCIVWLYSGTRNTLRERRKVRWRKMMPHNSPGRIWKWQRKSLSIM